MEMDDARRPILRDRGDVSLATLLLPYVVGAGSIPNSFLFNFFCSSPMIKIHNYQFHPPIKFPLLSFSSIIAYSEKILLKISFKKDYKTF